ncbi:MAG: glutathione S-transferase family protein [Alphaproteobacteria bacterium]|jgi:GST-like protein|nr:glutathione S-transferase family protein [Alphaproteobacteria bacterium]
MLKLFYAPTAPSLRVLLFLEETGTSYSKFPMNVFKKQNHNEEYAKIIPTKKTPSLLDDGKVFFDSANILLHLAQKENKLLPKENFNEVLSWFFWGASELNPKFAHHYQADDSNPEMLIRIRKQLDTLLALLDSHLSNKDYVAGTYSIADINIYTTIKTRLGAIPDLLNNFPNIQKWVNNIDKKESTKKVFDLAVNFDREALITSEEIKNFLHS